MTPCRGQTMARAPQGAAAFPGTFSLLHNGDAVAQPGSPHPLGLGMDGGGATFLGVLWHGVAVPRSDAAPSHRGPVRQPQLRGGGHQG